MIKNKNYIINNKNDIVLPILYRNNKQGIYNYSPKKSLILNVKNKNNGSYKILNSESNMIMNNGVKVIDGKNIYINGKNSNSIGLKKKRYLINQMSNEIGKMVIQSNSRPKQINKLNKYSPLMDDKEFLKLIQQRKNRMVYIGKI